MARAATQPRVGDTAVTSTCRTSRCSSNSSSSSRRQQLPLTIGYVGHNLHQGPFKFALDIYACFQFLGLALPLMRNALLSLYYGVVENSVGARSQPMAAWTI